MQYRLCNEPWGQEEQDAIERVIQRGYYTMGSEVSAFEKAFAEKMKVSYAVMCNSGSSANLLAIAALVYSGRLPRGSEVIVPAVSWSTTYFPLEQFGMKLVFVDIDADTLNMDPDALRQAITSQTKLVLLVNLLGNPNAFDQILPICKERDILVMEDNCESLGGVYNHKNLGTFGILGTYSSFYSHHICTMEGGMVVTNDRELFEYMLSIRAHGWTRNLPEDSVICEKNKEPFYESFRFIVPGFNLRPLELEGAIGIEQLKKLDRMVAIRRENAAYFCEQMKGFPQLRIQKEMGDSSWFGFAIILDGEWKGKRGQVIQELQRAEIEVRPIVAGNFTRSPAIRYLDYRIPAPLIQADDVHDHGFFVGNHSTYNFEQIDYLTEILAACFRRTTGGGC